MEGLPSSASVVRPKERRPEINQQNPFMRGNTIIRSKTFSPGPQSQYICRVSAHLHTYIQIEQLFTNICRYVFIPVFDWLCTSSAMKFISLYSYSRAKPYSILLNSQLFSNKDICWVVAWLLTTFIYFRKEK